MESFIGQLVFCSFSSNTVSDHHDLRGCIRRRVCWLLSKSLGRQSFHWQCNVSMLIPWYRGPQSQWKGTGTCSEAVHQRSFQCVPIASDQCIPQTTFPTGER